MATLRGFLMSKTCTMPLYEPPMRMSGVFTLKRRQTSGDGGVSSTMGVLGFATSQM